VSSELLVNKQEGSLDFQREFEEFKLEFYEALLDLVEELRRIKSERQNHQAEEKTKTCWHSTMSSHWIKMELSM
jgi:hypothetical protein